MDDAMCQMWDPMLDIQYGWVDNTVISDTAADVANDGIDLGWVTSSTVAMGVKHVFTGVTGSDKITRSFSATGVGADKGDNKALAMERAAVTADTAGDPPVVGVTGIILESGDTNSYQNALVNCTTYLPGRWRTRAPPARRF